MAMDIEHQRPPPPGYTCFRCGEKGHYINVCPTLGDPDFENKPKIKKATGIPTMFLKTIKNKDAVDRGLMVTGEGDLVVAMPNVQLSTMKLATNTAAANRSLVVLHRSW